MVLKQSNLNAKRKTITDNINLRTKISIVGDFDSNVITHGKKNNS